MRRATRISRLAAVAVLATAFPALGEPPTPDPNVARVEKLGKQFAAAFGRGDMAGVAAMYAEDAMAFPPEGEIVKGRPALEAMWKGVHDMGVQSVEFAVIDVLSSGNLLVETGKATLHIAGAGSAQATVTVKYVVVWKKQKDGSWKISRDIWNSLPAPAPAPTPAPAG